jgi:hypothetical protein
MKKTLQTIGVATLALLIAVTAVVPAVTTSAQTATTASCYTYFRDLTIGSTGTDVVALQTFLVSRGHLVMPVGVPMGYFGNLTRAAVAKYQVSKGITPTAGYFGPITRSRVALECNVTPTPDDDDDDNDNDDDLSGGEASLEQFQLNSGDDSNVEENDAAEIAEIEFDVEDGDVRINRVDLTFTANDSNEEEDPWDTFDTVRLLVDGDEIAEGDLSDEDEWLDEDEPYVFRLSNVDHIVREGESANIVIELTAQNSVDGADNDAAEWTIYVEDNGIRAEDAEGIQQYVGDEDETVTFDIDVEGEGDELNVRSSSDDPNATTLRVEEDERSDWHSIFVFDLESEEADIEIDSVQVDLESSAAVANVISDLVLEIDGEEFDDWSFVGTGSTTRTVQFDIDGDYVLDADSEVAVVLMAEFKAANGTNYNSGATIQASINDGDVEGEGADDIASDGSVSGEEHNLRTSGLTVDNVTTDSDAEDGIGTFSFELDLTAFEDDVYVAVDSLLASDNVGFDWSVVGGAAATSATVQSDADTADVDGGNDNYFVVEEGSTETFTITITVDPSSSGSFYVVLDDVTFTEDASDADPVQTFDFEPASEYDTRAVSITAN